MWDNILLRPMVAAQNEIRPNMRLSGCPNNQSPQNVERTIATLAAIVRISGKALIQQKFHAAEI
jgi:hypothetical protein